MKIAKTVLADMPAPYAVAVGDAAEGKSLYVASENREGPCYRFRPGRAEKETLWTTPGGVMNIVPDGEDMVWAIQRFFPIFQSKDAEIFQYRRSSGGLWQGRLAARLPYVHRIARFSHGGEQLLLACALCESKDFEQDWSHPGAVYVARPGPTGEVTLEPILTGLTKNHGLSMVRKGADELPLASGAEGVFLLSRAGDGGSWQAERIFDRETSEAVLFDLDGDGERELITIEGFHGDRMNVYKKSAAGWQLAHSAEIAFGHVLWVGEILGENRVLTASRAGDRDISLHTPQGDLGGGWKRETVDAGVGAAQIEVFAERGRAFLVAANHFANQAALYALE